MFENLTNQDVSTAIDELAADLGVKEDAPVWDLLDLLHKKDTQGCIQEITVRLGLPVLIPGGIVAGERNITVAKLPLLLDATLVGPAIASASTVAQASSHSATN